MDVLLPGIAARSWLHRRQVPGGWVEGGAGRALLGVAADLHLVVDDLTAAFGDVEDDPAVVGVAVPGAGAGIGEDVGLDLVGGEHGEARRPDDGARGRDELRRTGGIAAE